jgi:filamentous hemagglutinin
MAIKINGATVIADNQAFTTTSTISAAGNITGGNVSVVGTITAAGINTGSSPVSTTGNVIGGNILTGGRISAAGNIDSAGVITGNIIHALSGIIGTPTGVANLFLGNANPTTVWIGGDASNIFIANVNSTTRISGNLTANATISATGNITGSFFIGNGSQLTGIDATQIQSGTSNVKVVSSGGNVTIGVGGTNNVVVAASTGQFVTGVNSVSGNITGGNVLTAGLISATGAITGAALTGTSLTVSTGNITGGNLLLSGAILDSAQLDIQTTASNANIALAPNGTGIVTVSTQVSAVGNITGGNIRTAGLISATGNITGGNITINGNAIITGNLSVSGTETIFNVANLTVNDKDIIVANNVTGGANVNGSGLQAGNPATATWFFNNATTSWQSNIGITPTTNGTLALGGGSNYWGTAFITTASVTGNITGGNISATNHTGTTVSVTGAVTGAAITGTSLTVSTGNITGGNLVLSGAILDSGQLDIQTTASNGNIVLTPNGTGNVNTGANISVTGRVTAASVVGGVMTGSSVSVTGAVTGASVVGGVMTGSSVSVTGIVTGASVVGGVMTGSSVSVTGAVTGAGLTGTSLTVSTGTVTCGNIVNSNANGVGNIGSSATRFNQVFALASSAQYADLAEKYTADAEYAPGTVVVFGGSAEVTVDAVDGDRRVAGVVSTNPAYIMNDGLDAPFVAAVALTGRVPCLVTGTVRKGDLMIAAGLGRARAEPDPRVGTVIGKALEDFNGVDGTIEVVVGRF